MNEPWFDGNQWARLLGTLLGVFGGLLGSLAGTLAPRGKAKTLVLGAFGLTIAICTLFLIAGVVAIATGQPYGVGFGLLLPGLIGPAVLGSLLPVVILPYREAEQRKMEAHDLTSRTRWHKSPRACPARRFPGRTARGTNDLLTW
jgi:hypothetical protein